MKFGEHWKLRPFLRTSTSGTAPADFHHRLHCSSRAQQLQVPGDFFTKEIGDDHRWVKSVKWKSGENQKAQVKTSDVLIFRQKGQKVISKLEGVQKFFSAATSLLDSWGYKAELVSNGCNAVELCPSMRCMWKRMLVDAGGCQWSAACCSPLKCFDMWLNSHRESWIIKWYEKIEKMPNEMTWGDMKWPCQSEVKA